MPYKRKMNRQQVFDAVVHHLAKQGKRSTFTRPGQGFSMCRYRGYGGLKCAIGALIPDELYHPRLEGSLPSTWLSHFKNPEIYPVSEHSHTHKVAEHFQKTFYKNVWQVAFLFGLQGCHDVSGDVEQLRYNLTRFANKYKLKSESVEHIKTWKE